MNNFKTQVFQAIIHSLEEKLTVLQNDLEQYRIELSDNTKSSAGDKHETSRAMAQLEMEKLGKSFLETQKLLDLAKQISLNVSQGTIQAGSLVKTDKIHYLLGLPIGKIEVENIFVFCISNTKTIGVGINKIEQITLVTFQNIGIQASFINYCNPILLIVFYSTQPNNKRNHPYQQYWG